MKMQLVKISVIAFAALAALSIIATGLQAVNAGQGPRSFHANDVGFGANTNEGYIQLCKESQSAQECATGPGNNGEFTSGFAHVINGP